MNARGVEATSADAPVARGRFNSDWAQLWIGVALIAATGFGPSLLGNDYWAHTFHVVNIYIAASVFQNLLFVDAGQKSFGQGAILGLGAYGAAIAYGLQGVPFILAAVIGVLAALLGGLLFALPALRVQGFHLGFVTMSAGIVFPQLIVTLDKWTNGINGIRVAVPALTETWLLHQSPLSVILAIFPMLALGVHYALRQSRLGRMMRVAAASPEAARSLGVKPGVMRCIGFVIASIGTGICGVLYLPTVGFVSATAFPLELSFVFFFAVVVGGRGQLLGPIVGVWIIYILPNILLAQLIEYRLLIYGCLTLLAVMLFPDGIVGSIEHWRRKRAHKGGGDQAFRLESFIGHLPVVPEQTRAERPVIEVRGGGKRFGQVIALDKVDLTVRQGEVHGLVGANGSGKTSLLNVLTGLSRLDAGTMSISGAEATRMPADAIANSGVGRTFQAPRVFAELSLWDNLRIGVDGRAQPSRGHLDQLAADLERRFGQDSASLLSHGQRRLLEVTRTVLKEAPILLFDEPAAGLSPAERKQFSALVTFLSKRMGKTIVLVEHDLDLVWGLADTITVLEAGRVVASGEPAAVARDPAVQHMFVGARRA
ncbi:ABC transporter permease subunit [Terrarubrum flagellatum]|uniref:branched-chain amino acid ABC transporter ATP-binding protein/permease n=1 Tax=Terrirubrum flagellatum TaxID=2895980 RepID=UPI0031455289